eukprot:CAMPEP_0178997016 /NCGR_PEP_ID=MMETSP0795-20121207/8697_1 /TAXON_ID=88552 /ORGANISM="Amoebophrya sp., Strain Ameob2" /LENGTH=59 /DNA_ID=CAMNT_0020689485 /DNA_START=765 /DNA_END=944 /DNA_ORIENTATION=+
MPGLVCLSLSVLVARFIAPQHGGPTTGIAKAHAKRGAAAERLKSCASEATSPGAGAEAE